MKKYLFIPLLFLGSTVHATPARVLDGVLQFAISTVGGLPVFTQAEKDQAISENPGGNVVDLTPQSFEVNLSTCLVVTIDGIAEENFKSYSEWLSCQTKAGLKRKIRKIRELIDSMSDLPLSESKDLKERAGWIKSYYQSLP